MSRVAQVEEPGKRSLHLGGYAVPLCDLRGTFVTALSRRREPTAAEALLGSDAMARSLLDAYRFEPTDPRWLAAALAEIERLKQSR